MGSYVKKKVEYLVVDTSAFINKAAIQDIGENILTVPQVIDEVKSKRQIRRLVVLPYDLSVKEAFPENIKFVTEFSKKTGDYASLSATDINVLALTYQLEKEKNGVNHLKTAPVCKPVVEQSSTIPEDLKKIVGFYVPKKELYSKTKAVKLEDGESDYNSAEEGEPNNSTLKNRTIKVEMEVEKKSDNDSALPTVEESKGEEKFKGNFEEKYVVENDVEDEYEDNEENDADDEYENNNENDAEDENDTESKCENNDENNAEEECENNDENDAEEECENDDYDNDDNSDWITPSNIKEAKSQLASEVNADLENVNVACLTTDFAMQNVLKQIGLNVISVDGKLIKQLRTFILRCYGCFKTTSNMTKVFCPNCGNRTLKKVGVSLDANGTQHLHINFKKPLTARGKRHSLPHFKGGKHSNNPVICEDQPMPQQRPTRLSRTKNNPLNDDYIAGYSPFVTRDVYSKSAMLGIKPHLEMKHWTRKNVNESRKKKK